MDQAEAENALEQIVGEGWPSTRQRRLRMVVTVPRAKAAWGIVCHLWPNCNVRTFYNAGHNRQHRCALAARIELVKQAGHHAGESLSRVKPIGTEFRAGIAAAW